jgi:TPR repeat protein
MLTDGIGIKQNAEMAVKLLREAAEQGHERAQAKLAHHLTHGIGCPVDESEGFKWYQMAAENGD